MWWFSAIVVILGLALDFLNIYLICKWKRNGKGASPIPIIPLFLYAVPSWTNQAIFTSSGKTDFIILACLHIFINYLLPTIIGKIFQKNN